MMPSLPTTRAGRLGLGSTVVGVTLVLIGLVLFDSTSTDDASGDPVATGAPAGSTSSTAVSTSTTAAAAADDEPGDTDVLGVVIDRPDTPQPVTTPASSTPPTTADPCLFSYDPACGPFHWSPAVTNAPATLAVSLSPRNPDPGQRVTLTFRWSDGDADGASVAFRVERVEPRYDCAVTSSRSTDVVKGPYGPWTPPPARAGSGTPTATFTAGATGHYAAVVQLDTFLSSYDDFAAAHPPSPPADPYASTADEIVEFMVGDAQECSTTPSTTTTTTAPTTTSTSTSTTTTSTTAPSTTTTTTAP